MFTNKKEIKQWLDSMNIEHYTIRDDLTVDVDSYLYLTNKKLKEIPVQFGIVRDTFRCENNELIFTYFQKLMLERKLEICLDNVKIINKSYKI